MKKKIFNKNEYWSLESININKDEANKLFGKELLIRDNKMYVPKDVCSHKLLKLHKEYGEVCWETVHTRRTQPRRN